MFVRRGAFVCRIAPERNAGPAAASIRPAAGWELSEAWAFALPGNTQGTQALRTWQANRSFVSSLASIGQNDDECGSANRMHPHGITDRSTGQSFSQLLASVYIKDCIDSLCEVLQNRPTQITVLPFAH